MAATLLQKFGQWTQAGWSIVTTGKFQPKNDGTTAFVQLITPVDFGGNVIGRGAVTPAAGSAAAVATGGTAVTAVTGPINGGFITNPSNAARQAIAAAEPLYVDMVGTPGSTDAVANGTTSALDLGQSYTLPALATGVTVKVNAATNGHKFTVVTW